MSTIYVLYEYNNYYNRVVKRETSLNGYLSASSDYKQFENINFIPNNYIDTMQVLNVPDEVIPNYLLVLEGDSIKSRWFIVSARRTTANQVELTLHRDLMADYYDNLLDDDTVMFVEKGKLEPTNNLIFNKEDMSFNQIKQSETMLKDASESPWICIYAASKESGGDSTNFQITSESSVPVAFTFNSEEEFHNWEVYQNRQKLIYGYPKFSYMVFFTYYYYIGENEQDYVMYGDGTGYRTSRNPLGSIYDGMGSYNHVLYQLLKNTTFDEFANVMGQKVIDFSNDFVQYGSSFRSDYNQNLYNLLASYANTFVRVKNGEDDDGNPIYKYYQVNTASGTASLRSNIPEAAMTNYFRAGLKSLNDPYSDYPTNSSVVVMYSMSHIKVTFTDVTNSVSESSLNIQKSRYHLVDAPYDMFCIPYSDDLYLTNSVTNLGLIKSSKMQALNMTRALIEKYSGSGQIYDAQILPYCPITNSKVTKDEYGRTILDVNGTSNSYSIIYSGSSITGLVLHATRSSFSRDIQLEKPIVINNYKIESQTDMYRIVSPNYSGIFEFNAAKNGGLSKIHVQCTYKPYTPYIKLYPDWGRLYGSNFGVGDFDARGLICGGDFSLPMTSSAWATYELENKNYQNSFDRQIQNMEVSNSVQREKEKWQAGANVLSAFAEGKQLGDSTMLGLGGLFGVGNATGMAAAGLSAMAGKRDIELNNMLRSEALDYTQDLFGYSLQNIQALPQSLSKVTAYNVDNKYFPFLEYYSCSDVEKEALKNKIKYNGMTVMTLGKPSDFIKEGEQNYFKGKLVRMNSLNEDYHILNAIADELNKGVFI